MVEVCEQDVKELRRFGRPSYDVTISSGSIAGILPPHVQRVVTREAVQTHSDFEIRDASEESLENTVSQWIRSISQKHCAF